VRLRALFGFPRTAPSRFHAFVVGSGQDAVALGVDRILGQREIVVRTIADSLLRVDGISGATELGDGRVVLILDAAALARQARAGRREGRHHPGDASGRPAGTTSLTGGHA
jgi:two-component system chemotaxis sensor kinase CheA